MREHALTHGSGYSLEVDDGALDAVRFEHRGVAEPTLRKALADLLNGSAAAAARPLCSS